MNAIDATSARVDVGLNMSERDRLMLKLMLKSICAS